jgi:hypothetical protein
MNETTGLIVMMASWAALAFVYFVSPGVIPA